MGYMYTMQYFSTIKKEEIMPRPATGEKVEMIIPSGHGQEIPDFNFVVFVV